MPDDEIVLEILARIDGQAETEEWQRLARMSRELYPYTHLFEPIQVNRITLKNRIVMGPMGNISMAEEMGRPSQKMVDYYVERARGGVGLITSGLIPVSQAVDPAVTEPGDRSLFPRIDRSRTVWTGWRILAEAIHAYGAHFFIQLTPGLGRVGSPECLIKKYRLPVSSSWNPNYYIPAIPCRPLTDGECRTIIRATAQAAADAKSLLIDGVYLHGHEGYLLEQMTNPAFNRRAFGRYKDWQAFGLDLVKEIRQRVGPHYPLMYRIDLSLALNAAYGERMDKVNHLRRFKNERSVAMTLEYMENLVKVGVDMFDVDLGSYDNWWLPHPPSSVPSGCFLPAARLVKETFERQGTRSNAGLPVPVVAVGKLGYPDLAEKALRDGACDLVMLARPLLADPHWANKAFAGRCSEIRPCIGDQEGCLNEFLEGGHPQCSVNPRTGFEDVYERELIRTAHCKRVAVVGAGPAGVMCAVTVAQRGHHVTLFDRSGSVGGLLVPGSVPAFKYEVANYRTYLEEQVKRTCQRYDLELQLNTVVDAASLKGAGYDAVVICTGGKPLIPQVAGVDLPQVVQAIDLFNRPELAGGAQRIVVVGGGAVGCECAYFLASEHGKQVTVIEMLPGFMKGVCTANRGHLIHVLEQKGVQLLNCTRLNAIRPGEVSVIRNVSSSVPDPYNTWTPLLPENVKNPLAKPIREQLEEQTLPADRVILATGQAPDRRLYQACMENLAAPEIYAIGDGFQTGRVFEAVKAGFTIGRSL